MNTSSPFTENQQLLILAGAGIILLMAAWTLFKAFHPKWRGSAGFRLEPVGRVVLMIFAAAVMLAVVGARSFVARYPLVLPSLGVVGCLVWLACGTVDERRRKTKAVAPANAPLSAETPESESVLVRQAVWCARVLGVALVIVVVSFCGHLFGPQPNLLFSFIGISMAIFIFAQSQKPLGKRFLRVCPQGLSGRFPGLETLRKPLLRALMVSGVCASISVVVFFAGSRADGGPADDLPAFAPREEYALSNHGKRTNISRLRFQVIAAASVASVHLSIFFVSGLALHGVLFGRLPKELVRDLPIPSSRAGRPAH